MTDKEKTNLFEKCRKSLLKKVHEFAKSAAPHYVKNGWIWSGTDSRTRELIDYVPSVRDIKATTKQLIDGLSLKYSNNSTGRIQVQIVVISGSKTMAFGYIQLIHEETDVWVE
jgi:hypothetical protein